MDGCGRGGGCTRSGRVVKHPWPRRCLCPARSHPSAPIRHPGSRTSAGRVKGPRVASYTYCRIPAARCGSHPHVSPRPSAVSDKLPINPLSLGPKATRCGRSLELGTLCCCHHNWRAGPDWRNRLLRSYADPGPGPDFDRVVPFADIETTHVSQPLGQRTHSSHLNIRRPVSN